ncbi:MAG: thioredoxin domain-containing protein [Ectothiorhodospiraceae bacterium]|nr:thioredoxin domain-containing protein [Ectothiorhodospiraceae bacterium]
MSVKVPFLMGVALCLWVLTLPLAAENRLTGHDSPYLAMHGDDPVEWHDWSAEVLEQAKKQNKLLFVSIGYFACHWCHVMQRESYRDPQVAKILNKGFISVKVDRELNPALDAYLIDFVMRTRGAAGWPLNVFLTPDGNPLVGLTYLPKDRFLTLLMELQQQWETAPAYLTQAAARAAAAMKGQPALPDPALKPDDARRYETIFLQQAMQLGDEMEGGFGEQTKFPMVPQLDSLLSAYQRKPIPQLKAFLTLTLDRMASQGMRDHLGGGFYRYTTDPGWQTPHFEKMLYDNALLSGLYLRAAKVFNRVDYENIGRETLDFMLVKMRRPLVGQNTPGAMVASFSAVDAAGVEGGYYLWETETLLGILSREEYALMKILWGLEGQSLFDAGYLARLQMTLGEAADALKIEASLAQKRYQSAREKLLKVRGRRNLPVDDKRLAAWNGLALTALVQGAQLSGGEKYKRAAHGVRDYIVNSLWDGSRLLRAKARSKKGELGQAGLEDYAFAAEGLLAWSVLTDNNSDLQLAARWVKDGWRRFHDDTGWRLSDQTLLPSGFGVPVLDESPLPSPSTTLLRISLEIASRTGDKMLMARTKKALVAGHVQLKQAAFDYPSQVNLLAEQAQEK